MRSSSGTLKSEYFKANDVEVAKTSESYKSKMTLRNSPIQLCQKELKHQFLTEYNFKIYKQSFYMICFKSCQYQVLITELMVPSLIDSLPEDFRHIVINVMRLKSFLSKKESRAKNVSIIPKNKVRLSYQMAEALVLKMQFFQLQDIQSIRLVKYLTVRYVQKLLT